MYQLVARAPQGQLLFRTHLEARALWIFITTAFPEALSLVLMPNHVHLDLPHDDPDDRLRDVMSAFARWRNRHRGESGPVWDAHPHAIKPADAKHARRLRRYTLLNPVRGLLVSDPLSWPWSLHRECVGLGFAGNFPTEPKVAAFHLYVSRDNDTKSPGSSLPVGTFGDVKVGDVVDAVCGITRCFVGEILRRGRPRTLVLQTAWAHDLHNVGVLAATVGCGVRAVYDTVEGIRGRGSRYDDPELVACMRAVGDPRFHALQEGDLRKSIDWNKSIYRNMA